MTLARPTSEPVPAVVGTAMIGSIALASARVHQSPISSKSHKVRVWPRIKASIFPRSRPDPPPNATTPSCCPARYTSKPAATLISFGFGSTCENIALPKPAAAIMSNVDWVMGRSASPLSVTRSGFVTPAVAQASGKSEIRPAPKRIAVG